MGREPPPRPSHCGSAEAPGHTPALVTFPHGTASLGMSGRALAILVHPALDRRQLLSLSHRPRRLLAPPLGNRFSPQAIAKAEPKIPAGSVKIQAKPEMQRGASWELTLLESLGRIECPTLGSLLFPLLWACLGRQPLHAAQLSNGHSGRAFGRPGSALPPGSWTTHCLSSVICLFPNREREEI